MNSYLENSNKYYNLTTGAYRLYFGEHFHLFLWSEDESRDEGIKRTNDIFLSDGKLSSNSEVIDLGCGIGSLSILIAKKYGCKVTGVNVNKHQLTIARKRAKQNNLNINFFEQDIMQLDLDKKFDTAFFIDIEPHLPDKKKAIINIKRILQKNGRIVMTAWLQTEKPNFAQKEFLIKPFCRLAAFSYMETFSGYRDIFEKAGLKIIKFKDITAEARRSVDDFYLKVFRIIKEYNSLETMSKIVTDITFLKTLTTSNFRKAAEDAFLGPIYAKLCLDAEVFKLGYFVLENKFALAQN